MPPTPRTPNPPPASGRRGDKPSLVSPSYSRHPFRDATAAASAVITCGLPPTHAAVSEHPCVKFSNWWLTRVEGDDQKIAVGGSYKRDQAELEFAPAIIAKRLGTWLVETEDGIVLSIGSDSFNVSRTIANGYSSKVCEYFMLGFPHWWQSCNLLYPKETSTSNSKVDSTRFYLEKFQLGQRLHLHASSLLSQFRNSVRRYSHNDAAFQKSSHLPDGTPRFEEYTGDGDIAINENAAASNDNGEKLDAACNEVYNVDMHMTAGIALRERDGGDIDTDASSVLTMVCTNDASDEEADNAPSTSDQRTQVISLKTQGCWKKTGHMALNEKAAVDEEMPTSVCLDVQNSSYLSNETPSLEKNTCIGDTPTNGGAATLNDSGEKCIFLPEEVNSSETSFVVGSITRERGHDDDATNVSLIPRAECTNDAVNEGVDNTSLLGCKTTPVASVKSQGCQEKQQHIPSNQKPSGPPKKRRSALQKLRGATRSPLTSPVPYAHDSPLTRGRATSLSMSTPESLKLKKTRSGRVVVPTLDKGCQRIVYDMDGVIIGIAGCPCLPAGTTSAREKRAEPAAAASSKLKTYARKKRKAE